MTVLAVETRRERVHRSAVNVKDVFLHVTQVRRHEVRQGTCGAFCAVASTEEEMMNSGQLWYEVSLQSRKIRKCLRVGGDEEAVLTPLASEKDPGYEPGLARS